MRGLILLSFIAYSLLLGCNNQNGNVNENGVDTSMIGYTIEPKRHSGIPSEAKWMKSIDSFGGWFYITKPNNLKTNEYRIVSFNYYLDVEIDVAWDAIFKLETKGEFSINKPYEFVPLCDYERCTIKQGENNFIFSFTRNYKN